ncbi:MAG: hypothetical protein COT89_01830 [Candidatus Colwellbacteria bacterium CG10_big_fil_rev_8_21_14_0_10_42_22]|uniref:LTD domain-containing protein n=1 Tax=Candidatus Colwellbacteria bacterium CG10_big_fil_rev_8_21_14_0_10_42_22 TaxID=1974540 RepID=A0A2H0VI33_9BACT|nr:MAG: hypothetical protein COT89_01830 [Candidatus Colwellbacteria bacterium CG10_big_fil_rev_8_21_14_0_10_42_22]
MVYIESVLPNPIGKDSGQEWIRLLNEGGSLENLLGWRIEDGSKKVFDLSAVGEIEPGEIVELGHAFTEISLNNDGDTLFLYDKQGSLIDTLEYGPVEEGEILLNKTLTETREPQNTNALANIAETGVLNKNILNKDVLGPIELGLLVAAMASTLFVYLSINIFRKNE